MEMTKETIARYTAAWDALLPDIKRFIQKLDEIVREAAQNHNMAPESSEICTAGDEEFLASLSWTIPGREGLVGIDVTLTDAIVRGEDEEGYGLIFELLGHRGHIASYIPENMTPNAFLDDLDMLRYRIEEMEREIYTLVDEVISQFQSFSPTQRTTERP